MDNIYETMWKDNKRWIESSIIYHSNLLNSYHPDINRDYDRVVDRLGTFQFMLDKLEKDEEIYTKNKEDIKIGK